LTIEPAEDPDEGPNEQLPALTEEETRDRPSSLIEAARVLRMERVDIPTVILRISGVYDEVCHSIPIAQQINHVNERKLESYFFPGDPDHGQAFVHVDDLTACLRKVVELRSELGPSEIFLIAEPDVM